MRTIDGTRPQVRACACTAGDGLIRRASPPATWTGAPGGHVTGEKTIGRQLERATDPGRACLAGGPLFSLLFLPERSIIRPVREFFSYREARRNLDAVAGGGRRERRGDWPRWESPGALETGHGERRS